MSDTDKLVEGCTLLGLTVVVAFVSYFVLAFVVGQMWDWYITPVFEVARPGYAYLVGLCILTGYITNSASASQNLGVKKDSVTPWTTFGALFYDALIAPFMILLVGWLVHFFI